MKVNSISPEETCTIHTKSDKIKIMMGSETNNVIEKLCEALLEKLEELMRVSTFACDSVNLLYYHLTTQ